MAFRRDFADKVFMVDEQLKAAGMKGLSDQEKIQLYQRLSVQSGPLSPQEVQNYPLQIAPRSIEDFRATGTGFPILPHPGTGGPGGFMDESVPPPVLPEEPEERRFV